jgi:predicted transcriptional regulator
MDESDYPGFIQVKAGHRSNVQIVGEILQISARSSVTRSYIIARVRLDYIQTKRYLEWLINLNLLEVIIVINKSTRYKTTIKGHTLLLILMEIQKSLDKSGFLRVLPARVLG